MSGHVGPASDDPDLRGPDAAHEYVFGVDVDLTGQNVAAAAAPRVPTVTKLGPLCVIQGRLTFSGANDELVLQLPEAIWPSTFVKCLMRAFDASAGVTKAAIFQIDTSGVINADLSDVDSWANADVLDLSGVWVAAE